MPVPEISPCELATNLVVGEEYPTESEDGLQTGVFRITSIDTDNCQACFLIVSGDWSEFTENDRNVKIFYGPNQLTDYCILNPDPEPVWVPFIAASGIWDGAGFFNGTCWERNTDAGFGTSIRTTSGLDILETAGVHAIRFNYTTTSTANNIEMTVDSNSTPTPASISLDFSSSSDPQNIQFDFDPEVPLAPSAGVPFRILIDNVGGYQNNIFCDIELLVDADREQEFLDLL